MVEEMDQFFCYNKTQVWLNGPLDYITRAVERITELTPEEAYSQGKDLKPDQKSCDIRRKDEIMKEKQMTNQANLILFQYGANSGNQNKYWKH